MYKAALCTLTTPENIPLPTLPPCEQPTKPEHDCFTVNSRLTTCMAKLLVSFVLGNHSLVDNSLEPDLRLYDKMKATLPPNAKSTFPTTTKQISSGQIIIRYCIYFTHLHGGKRRL